MSAARVVIEFDNGIRVLGVIQTVESDGIQVELPREAVEGPTTVWLAGTGSVGSIRFASFARKRSGGIFLATARLGARGRQRLREMMDRPDLETPAPDTPRPEAPFARPLRTPPPSRSAERPFDSTERASDSRERPFDSQVPRVATPQVREAPVVSSAPAAPKAPAAIDVAVNVVPFVQCDADLVRRALALPNQTIDLKGLDARPGRSVVLEFRDPDGRTRLVEGEVRERRGAACRVRLRESALRQ